MATVRGVGDAGSSARHAWVPGQLQGFTPTGAYSIKPKKSAYRGVPYSGETYSKSLCDISKKDFAMTLRTPGKTTGLAPSSQGGAFYVRKPCGKLKVGAFYARPEAQRFDHAKQQRLRRSSAARWRCFSAGRMAGSSIPDGRRRRPRAAAASVATCASSTRASRSCCSPPQGRDPSPATPAAIYPRHLQGGCLHFADLAVVGGNVPWSHRPARTRSWAATRRASLRPE